VKNLAGGSSPPDSDPFSDAEFEKISSVRQANSPATKRRFQFNKRGQLFIGSHNETLSVSAMRISNPDCSPFAVQSCDTAPTPTGFAEIIRDNFPVLSLRQRSNKSRPGKTTSPRSKSRCGLIILSPGI
jgi:hypothetical protein